MAMVVSFPAAGAKVGPGYLVTMTGAAGPTAVDDLLLVRVQDSLGTDLAQGSRLLAGSTSAGSVIGVFGSTNHPAQAFISSIAPGAAAQINLQRYNVGGSLIEQTTTTGFVWDPTGASFELTSILLEQNRTAGLAAVLAAVSRTYTTP